MANWAIVIGIDQYWTPEACLRGAVRDALNMREWLISVEGGAVPSRNLTLLLGPSQTSPPPPAGVQLLPASSDMAINAVEQLLQRSGGQGERFFFYYSGHGLTSRMDFSNENGIILSDFSDELTRNSLTLRSIFELFQATQFQEQFFIIDACRNIPWEREFRLGEYPNPRKPSPPVRPQFIMYATSPGVKAVEIQHAENERGAFTEALLDGLKGKGIAKVWDDQAQEYLLRWDNLFKYVEAEVANKKLNTGDHLIQTPRQAGERGSHNPELGRFPIEVFPDVTLDVNLDPNIAAPQTQIVIGDLGGPVDSVSSISQLPVRFSLKPRTYSVRAAASDFRPERTFYPIDLYSPDTLLIKLQPGQFLPPSPARVLELTKGLEGPRTLGAVEVRSYDILAKLELLDNTGIVITAAEGYLQYSNLAPGFYRARLVIPEGNHIEKLIELLPGDTAQVVLEAPKPPDSTLFQEVIAKTGISVLEDNSVEPSEAVGPVATAHVSTLLALAGGAVNEDTFRGYKLRSIGISSFHNLAGPQADSGAQILFGIEGASPDQATAYLAQIKLRCWRRSQPMPEAYDQPAALSSPVGLAEFAWEMTPGQYWLAIQAPDQRPVTLAITVLPQRLVLIVFQRGMTGEVNIYQYLPSLVPGDPNDPRTMDARFPVLQRSELIQRSYLRGSLEEPIQNAIDMLYAKWVEPIAGCLGGYLLLKINPNHHLLKIATNNMTRHFGELSDSHVLMADYLANEGQAAQAAEAYRAALDRGLPVVSDGLIRLVDGIRRYGIEHPQVNFVQEVFKNRVRGLLWTAVPVADDTSHIFSISGVVTTNQSGGVNLGAGAQLKDTNVVGRDQHIENRTAGGNYYEARDHAQMTIYQTGPGAGDPLRVFDELREALDRLDLPPYEKRKARHYVDGARLEAGESHKDEAAENLKQAAALIRTTAPSALGATEFGRLLRQCLQWTGKDENWLAE